jgi:hypothetical protein
METRYTLILVPEGQSAVRRYTILGSNVKRGAIGLGVIAFFALILVGDWVRLRLQAVDVDKLRAETQVQRVEIVELSEDVTRANQELERLAELERKIRIIADLPATLAQTGDLEAWDGTGGPDDEDLETGEPPPAVAEPDRVDPIQLDPIALVRRHERIRNDPHAELPSLREWAADVLRLVLTRGSSLHELADGLKNKRVQLAATPSIWPARGWVTSGYGRRVHPMTGRRHFHAGLDIAASFGTQVIAPANARVAFAGRKNRALGKTVILDHGTGTRTWYGHLAEVHVKRGERVSRGQKIGAVGSTGRSTGPHLHYVVEVKGKTVNPIDYVID